MGICSIKMWVIAMVAVTMLTRIHSQDIASSCCSANMMDSANKVVIDTLMKRSGRFNAIKVLMCTTTLTYIQLWRQLEPVSSNRYQLFHQWDEQPTGLNEYKLVFDEETEITDDIRVGFFSPGVDKHNVPYLFSAEHSHSLVSMKTFAPTDVIAVGDEIVMDPMIWPRSFRYNAMLCVDRDCADVVSLLPFVIPGPVGPAGPPGPPGEQGQPCDPFAGGLVGDAVGGINNQMNDIKSDTQRLADLMIDMGSKINELTQANFVTGTCPPGFLSATYGIGSCYLIFRNKKVLFAEAHFACSEKYKGHIVDIFSDLEQTYLRNTISQLIASSGNGGMEEYWTSGMFSYDMSQWVWYDEVRRFSIPMLYENWHSEAARSTGEGLKICIKLVVDSDSNQSYWEAEYCESKHYFICKIEKQCL